jgi:hypothetical protein
VSHTNPAGNAGRLVARKEPLYVVAANSWKVSPAASAVPSVVALVTASVPPKVSVPVTKRWSLVKTPPFLLTRNSVALPAFNVTAWSMVKVPRLVAPADNVPATVTVPLTKPLPESLWFKPTVKLLRGDTSKVAPLATIMLLELAILPLTLRVPALI